MWDWQVSHHALYVLLLTGLLSILGGNTDAAQLTRCGIDAFGNPICMDKDGIITPHSAVSSSLPNHENISNSTNNIPLKNERVPMRCGIDPFGNRVCYQPK